LTLHPNAARIALPATNPLCHMTYNFFLAWSWFGHGQLTEMALAYGISQFAILRKLFVLKRLRQFEAVQSAIEEEALGQPGFPPTEKEVKKFLEDQVKRPSTSAEQSLVRLFSELPSWVQEEDIHRGNIPKIGEWMEQDSQVRHYMRSYRTTTSAEAHQKSREYIWDHLYWAWSGMRKGVYHQPKWYDFINDSSLADFDAGVKHLAQALHTIEDSYAPCHTKRASGTGIITDIFYWPDTKDGNKSRGIPSHEDLDDPGNAQSKEFYAMAKNASGVFILCVLRNLDQDQNVYLKDCGDILNTYLNARL
jgi:hypothetical protein